MTENKKEALEAAIAAMTKSSPRSLFDVTIICTTDDFQAEFWMKRLSEGLCASSSDEGKFPMVLAVSEDWASSGAGNGLGTLYAYQKAAALAEEKHGIKLSELLKAKEVSAALYHTAGKGTRLAPLPASENNNKPGVKLPCCHKLSDGSLAPITVLEAVVKQTGVYAATRKGRLSVFWGDQVFIPSAPFTSAPTHHVDIMCTLLGETAPTAEEWKEKGLDKYGVIAVAKGEERNAAQVEKVDHATALKMLESLGDIGQVGPSLGSFSVSAEILDALCEEFKEELTAKTAKMDTDPHFWMPLTLPKADYITLMETKDTPKEESEPHHERMTKMKEGFKLGDMGLFGAVDVGSEAAWWDYGQLKLYTINNVKLMEDDYDAQLLRKFLEVEDRKTGSTLDGVTVDDASCVFASTIKAGSIQNSVLASVKSLDIKADGAIIVNCTARKIEAGKGAILYNMVTDSEEGLVAKEGEVMVTVTNEEGEMILLKSNQAVDGKKSWSKVLEGNTHSFEGMHFLNSDSNVSEIEEERTKIFAKTAETLGLA